MPTQPRIVTSLLMMLIVVSIGCDEDENRRLAEMAQRHEQIQAEQNQRTAKLQQDLIALQNDVQQERAEIGQQRDQLENERREIASQRRFDSLLAAAVANIGLLLACLLPLVLAWQLLRHRDDPVDEQALVEVMLDDLVADRPLLLDRSPTTDDGPRRLPGDNTDMPPSS